MRFVLKIFAAPFVLALSLAVGVLSFVFSLASWAFSILSLLFAVCALFSIFIEGDMRRHFGTLCPEVCRVWGGSPTSIFAGPSGRKNSECLYTRPACRSVQPQKRHKKTESAFSHFPRFFGVFDCPDYSFHQPQVFFVHRTEHHINAAFASAGGSLVWIKELIHRYIEHCHHLIKGVQARMLTVVFVIHDGAGITVNDIGKLLLCHSAGFTRPLDSEPYIMEIKFALIAFKLHRHHPM